MKWLRHKHGHIIDEKGNTVYFRSIHTLCSGTVEKISQAERNTDLACAAPELLFSLEEMVADWDDELSQEAQVDFVGRARRAISKAKGERYEEDGD